VDLELFILDPDLLSDISRSRIYFLTDAIEKSLNFCKMSQFFSVMCLFTSVFIYLKKFTISNLDSNPYPKHDSGVGSQPDNSGFLRRLSSYDKFSHFSISKIVYQSLGENVDMFSQPPSYSVVLSLQAPLHCLRPDEGVQHHP
jgi:hypothetical protein